jgi:formylglycine-generating enzyme required for sulfatase activity
MSKDVAARLGSLAKDHREGRLTLLAYRKLRAPLLDSLMTRDVAEGDVATTTQPRSRAQAALSLAPAALAADAALPGSSTPRKRRFSPAAVTVAIVASLGAVGFAAWELREPQPAASSQSASPAQAKDVELTGAHAIVQSFLDARDWSNERLLDVRHQLDEVGDQEMAAAAITPWFRNFAAEVRKRLKEQQALASAPLTPDNSPIAALAVSVGIDLPKANPKLASVPAAKNLKPTNVASAAAAPVTAGAASASQPAKAAVDCRAEPASESCKNAARARDSGPRLAMIPAGSNKMGSEADASGVQVTFHKAFGIAIHEVTQAQFRRFCERAAKPFPRQPWANDSDPIVNVTWQEAKEYLEWLSTSTGQRYRLPTESEWVYAIQVAREGAGEGESGGAQFAAVEKISVGNVREWVQDASTTDLSALGGAAVSGQRVVRGTSYADEATTLLTARRTRDAQTRDALTGFRVVKELP